MQGIPGSGKSFLAQQIAASAERSAIFSADDYFQTPDGYVHDVRKLGAAHAWNDARLEARLAASAAAGLDDLLILDNTNLLRRDVQRVLGIAARYGATVRVEKVDTPIEVCLARNAARSADRRVPEQTVRRMATRAQELLPDA
jgi:predicted kinase